MIPGLYSNGAEARRLFRMIYRGYEQFGHRKIESKSIKFRMNCKKGDRIIRVIYYFIFTKAI